MVSSDRFCKATSLTRGPKRRCKPQAYKVSRVSIARSCSACVSSGSNSVERITLRNAARAISFFVAVGCRFFTKSISSLGSIPGTAIGECQEFRVRACIMGTKEITHGTTKRADYPR